MIEIARNEKKAQQKHDTRNISRRCVCLIIIIIIIHPPRDMLITKKKTNFSFSSTSHTRTKFIVVLISFSHSSILSVRSLSGLILSSNPAACPQLPNLTFISLTTIILPALNILAQYSRFSLSTLNILVLLLCTGPARVTHHHLQAALHHHCGSLHISTPVSAG